MSKETKKETAPARAVEGKPAAPPAPAPDWREDGTHKDSAPLAERTVKIVITKVTRIHCGTAAPGHRTRVTPAEYEALKKEGACELVI